MKFQAVIFDFDYTLADSSRGIVASVNKALYDLGFPLAAPEAIYPTIGMSLPKTFVTLVGQEYAAQGEAFTGRFKHHADEIMVGLTTLYATVDPTMRLLKQQQKKLGIVSTKYRYRIEGVLQRDHASDLFDIIVGGEDVANHKPDPEGLYHAISVLGCSPEQALYVGDSVIDAETAKRAQVSFMAVLSGVTSREAFDDYPVLEIIDDLSHLPKRFAL